ncbi:arginase [soil metagenome]
MELQVVTVPYRYDEYQQGTGGGPQALLDANLIDGLTTESIRPELAGAAFLADEDRQPGRTAINIGKLGASTANLVSRTRNAGAACLVLAGDDTAAIGVVSGLQAAHGPGARIGIIWVDAHGDFNTPETSYSGILAGMSLAIVAGLAGPKWRDAAQMAAPIPTDRIIIVGARQLDAKEEALLRVTDVSVVTTNELVESCGLHPSLERLIGTVDMISLHVDLDVLEPHLVPSSSTPSPDGLTIEQAATTLGSILGCGKVATLTIVGTNPGGGNRGRRTIQSAMSLLTEAIPLWTQAPPPPI